MSKQNNSQNNNEEEPSSSSSLSYASLSRTLAKIDPVLQFLIRATGHSHVSIRTFLRAWPFADTPDLLRHVQALVELGVLSAVRTTPTDDDTTNTAFCPAHVVDDVGRFSTNNNNNKNDILLELFDVDDSGAQQQQSILCLGFPNPDPDQFLHGCSKAAAKRRQVALKKRAAAKQQQQQQQDEIVSSTATTTTTNVSTRSKKKNRNHHSLVVVTPNAGPKEEDDTLPEDNDDETEPPPTHNHHPPDDELQARHDLCSLLGFEKSTTDQTARNNNLLPDSILPRQASFAGSHPAQKAQFVTTLSPTLSERIPPELLQLFLLDQRPLYSHQASAIAAALQSTHVSVCTGTGSGKSLCFLLPVLTAAYTQNATSLLLFPTKALAQDQLSKLQSLLKGKTALEQRIRPATLDGDTTQAARSSIRDANVILTNPDTLHAAVLPHWKKFQTILSKLQFVVLDEAHVYDGVFGSHVSMVLTRLVRVCAALDHAKKITFCSCSATLPFPETHFRSLCPIAETDRLLVLAHDGSPRSAKHFFVWNPPVLHLDGSNTGSVAFPRCRKVTLQQGSKVSSRKRSISKVASSRSGDVGSNTASQRLEAGLVPVPYRRRHAAEEMARLLAKAVVEGVRCVAFCKTRNLVEWVYKSTLEVLTSNAKTAHLASKVESYRGGYTVKERRKIEQRLFSNDIIGVVGTNALELGVDIGGIDLTLHCGYPTSHASLLQQAGRAGRGIGREGRPSIAIVVCFNSPSEQQIWRRPQTLLGTGSIPLNTIPLRKDVVQGHLLCAGEEFPLAGSLSVNRVMERCSDAESDPLQCDRALFAFEKYDMALEALKSSNSLLQEEIVLANGNKCILYKPRPSFRKAWSRLSLRSIEPINYSVVDLSHPKQGGNMDQICHDDAILDTLPYSRVFYHAHPGAIITHRARKFKIVSMTRPPIFATENFGYRRSLNLAAYAKPTNARYLTRPLSSLQINIVKNYEVVELRENVPSPLAVQGGGTLSKDKAVQLEESSVPLTLAGCGTVAVKRAVHGYKKISAVTRSEISRSELSLPPIEYETFGLYICADSESLSGMLGERFGPGVHALSHALLEVAPLFAPGLSRGDLESDHNHWQPTQVVLFDERAGGSGCVERLWKCFFQPDSILEAAIDLLEHCSWCSSDTTQFDGGCPACLHAPQCSKFNLHLSRSAAVIIGKRMLERIQQTDLYKSCSGSCGAATNTVDTTPRRRARNKALRDAKELSGARERQFVVGRPTWPLDQEHCNSQQESVS